ncbi:DNA-3-methyladenine glycosylase [Thalassotalea aquiviva]|uniref:DNA-3-methyladenine glycosylase family protein n=1 Tax=Thalassotalea aquiviva TaxID=3242415 RepID=UPI00352B3975
MSKHFDPKVEINVINQNNLAAKNGKGQVYVLPFQGDLNWPLMLNFFKQRMIPKVEYVEHTYQRTICYKDIEGWIEVSKPEQEQHLRLYIELSEYKYIDDIIEKVRKMFDLDCDLNRIHQHLSQDQQLKPIMAKYPGLRLPGCWDLFEFSVRAILGQQISVKAATTIAKRIAHRYGDKVQNSALVQYPNELGYFFPTDLRLANANFNEIGLTQTRITTLQNWAVFYRQFPDVFALNKNTDSDYERFTQQLCAVKGIGPWTANYIAMRGLKMNDALPASDLGLIKALSKHGTKVTPKQIIVVAQSWRPWRAYAAIYLWQSLTH